MAYTLNEAGVIRASETVEQTNVSDGMRLARNCVLEELPGLIFAIMTLVYIVQSLAGLTL